MIEALDRQKFGGRAEAMRQQETEDVVSRSICCSAIHHGESKDDNGSKVKCRLQVKLSLNILQHGVCYTSVLSLRDNCPGVQNADLSNEL